MNFKDITPNDLLIHFNAPKAKVRVIEVFDGQLFTAERKEILKSDNGLLKSDVDKDILKVCVIERHKNSGRIGKGFVKGFGITEGALASSVAHDSHNVVAIGTNDEDICLAVNTLRRFGGGLIVAKNGGIVEKLALRVAGLMSAKSPKFVSGKMVALHNAALSLGCCLSSPFATLSFISLPVIPELKITDRGIIDVKKFKIVSLIV
jgi:adenine deaminase